MRKPSLLAVVTFTGALVGVLAGARPAAAHGGDASGTQPAADAAKEGEKKVRFYGLGLAFAMYDGTGLNAVNYTNDLSFYITPSWSAGKVFWKGSRFETFKLSLRIPITQPLVGYDEGGYAYSSDLGPAVPCSNLQPGQGGTIDPTQVQRCSYSQQHRTEPGDLWFTISNAKIVTIPAVGINVSPGIRVTIPTSKESQYQTLRAGLGGSLRFDRAWWSDRIDLGYSFGFTKNFHKFTNAVGQGTGSDVGDGTVGYSPNYFVNNSIAPGQAEPFNATSGAGRNASYSFQHIFNLDIKPTEKLGLSVLYIVTDAFKYTTPDTWTDPATGMTYPTYQTGMDIAGNNGTNILKTGHSDSQIFWATISYDVTDWMDVSLALITVSPQRKPDGSVRQPFLSTDYSAFSQVSFGAGFVIEKLAAKLVK